MVLYVCIFYLVQLRDVALALSDLADVERRTASVSKP